MRKIGHIVETLKLSLSTLSNNFLSLSPSAFNDIRVITFNSQDVNLQPQPHTLLEIGQTLNKHYVIPPEGGVLFIRPLTDEVEPRPFPALNNQSNSSVCHTLTKS
ncbi:CLUMA_CG011405, isoform A [Clunio marinus]|uniref:CLUMA_CG011405, isoform A n=1 Tax=Clunio marinus TaxID=568069 RepID=A0A1J1IEQ3_9DIPT|nr:CLUMA_CG011405, isoform A [Clunio marinus]